MSRSLCSILLKVVREKLCRHPRGTVPCRGSDTFRGTFGKEEVMFVLFIKGHRHIPTCRYRLIDESICSSTVMTFFLFSLPAYLSVSCNPLTSSKLMIQPLPQYPAEGESIFLQVHNLPEDVNAFFWYKSKNRTPVLRIVEYVRTMHSITWGLAHKRRGMVYFNGSLVLHNVTEKDAGMYTLEVLNKNFDIQKAYVEFSLKSK